VRAHTEYLWFNTRARRELVNITERIAEIVAAAKIAEGSAWSRPCTSPPASG